MFHGPNGQPKVKSKAAALDADLELRTGRTKQVGGVPVHMPRPLASFSVSPIRMTHLIESIIASFIDEAAQVAQTETIAEVASESLSVLRPSISLASLATPTASATGRALARRDRGAEGPSGRAASKHVDAWEGSANACGGYYMRRRAGAGGQ